MHELKSPLEIGWSKKRDKAALVGNIERIQAEDLASPSDFFGYWNLGFVDVDLDFAGLSDLVQCAGESPACQVAQAVDLNSFVKQRKHQVCKRSTVTPDRAFELQSLAY